MTGGVWPERSLEGDAELVWNLQEDDEDPADDDFDDEDDDFEDEDDDDWDDDDWDEDDLDSDGDDDGPRRPSDDDWI